MQQNGDRYQGELQGDKSHGHPESASPEKQVMAEETKNRKRIASEEEKEENKDSKKQRYLEEVEVLRFDVKKADAWFNLGNVGGGKVGDKDYSKKQCYEESLCLDPKKAYAWYHLGYLRGGKVGDKSYSREQCYKEMGKYIS